MKNQLMLLLVFVAMLASCTKEEILNESSSLDAHLAQNGAAEGTTSGFCYAAYRACLDDVGVTYDDAGEFEECNPELLLCKSELIGCLNEAVDAGGGSWNVVPVWTDYPEYIDFQDNDITFEFKLYDVDAEDYVSSPSSYVQGIEVVAIGLQHNDLSYDTEDFITSSASLDGDTYTISIDGEDLENEFQSNLAIDFRLRLQNSAIPTISYVNTVDDYIYTHVTLFVMENY